MVFHEITKDAIRAAVQNTRELDLALVDAQETRRILDRLYGWDVSPVLWFKVQQGTSAGRVQSAATRLVVDRERERMAFVSASYWGIDATAVTLREATDPEKAFSARLVRIDGGALARGTAVSSRRRFSFSARPRRTTSPRPSAPRRAHPSPTSRRSREPAAPRPRSPPPRCSRRPVASSR